MDLLTFTLFVFVLVLLGIVKDVITLAKWLERWLRNKGNGDPKRPASMEALTVLMREQSDCIGDSVKGSFDTHFQALMAESRKTNDLLTKFLIGQRIIAKNVHGIDLDI